MTDLENLEAIIGSLDRDAWSEEIRQITGMSEATIADVLGVHTVQHGDQRRHLEIVADLMRRIADARQAATDSLVNGVCLRRPGFGQGRYSWAIH